jgi:SAM-dependent methyltransferase
VCVLDQGQVAFDGEAKAGIRHYHAMLRHGHQRQPDGSHAPAGFGRATDEQLDQAWHRQAVGGRWNESGEWQFEFLRRHGLTPSSYVLDMGCGSLAGAKHLLPFLEQSHYWGFEIDQALYEAGVTIELARAGIPAEWGHVVVNDQFDLHIAQHPFDLAIANSFFRRLPLNRIARCLASVMTRLVPGGRFYATWLDNPQAASLEPITWPDGTVSHADAEPYHYTFDLLATVCASLGYRAERLPDTSHPRGESVLVITDPRRTA